MKKISYLFIGLLSILVLISACSKEEKDPVLNTGQISAPAFTNPSSGEAYILLEDFKDEVLTTFKWSATTYNLSDLATTTYKLEMALTGTEFADPIFVDNTTETEYSMTVGEMNTKLIEQNFPADEVANLSFRITSSITSNNTAEMKYSGLIDLALTPYSEFVEYPVLYVPGSYQGWDPSNTETVLASPNFDGTYEGYIYFADAGSEFKFTTQQNWDHNWGDDDADGTLDVDGANIIAADAGMYKINVDTIAKTYTHVLTNWGLIGSAQPGGWDTDIDMTYNTETGLYELTVDLVAGEIKFRANDDWAINLGDDGANGVLTQDGANIVIESDGTYFITLKLGAPDYTYTIEAQ